MITLSQDKITYDEYLEALAAYENAVCEELDPLQILLREEEEEEDSEVSE